MCGPMNRKGRLCNECIEGFGLSIRSLGLVYSSCTGAWYGIPLYLFLEFIPLTAFYVIILLFRVNVTSAPMVAFVIFGQVIVSNFIIHGANLKFEHAPYCILFHPCCGDFLWVLELRLLSVHLPPILCFPKA